jgi:hypothetical protein
LDSYESRLTRRFLYNAVFGTVKEFAWVSARFPRKITGDGLPQAVTGSLIEIQ